MGSRQYFGGVIWTNHALKRLDQRGLTQKMAYEAFQFPQSSVPGREIGTIEYRRRWGNSLVSVIAKQNEKKEWLILSLWINPPLPGSIDLEKKNWQSAYQKASFWGKFWLEIKKQMGF